MQPEMQQVAQQVAQPVAQPIKTMESQILQTPDGKLFMLPSNTYPVLQPVEDQPMTLQTVTVQGTNNQAFNEPAVVPNIGRLKNPDISIRAPSPSEINSAKSSTSSPTRSVTNKIADEDNDSTCQNPREMVIDATIECSPCHSNRPTDNTSDNDDS